LIHKGNNPNGTKKSITCGIMKQGFDAVNLVAKKVVKKLLRALFMNYTNDLKKLKNNSIEL